MSFSELIAPFLGRVVLAWYFLGQVWLTSNNWHETLATMAEKNVPAAPLVLVLALAVMVLGGLALLFGFHTRHGAMLLFAFTIAAAVTMHDYWHIDPNTAHDAHMAAYELFVREIAIAGALLFIVGIGPGRFAIDNRGKKQSGGGH
jgi:putative oxidoreductase